MRLIDADKLCPDCFTRSGKLAISQSQIAEAPTVDTTCPNCDSGYAQGYSDGYLKGKGERTHGKWIEHTSEEMSKIGFVKCSKCKAGFRRYERGVRHSDLPWIDGQPYELHLIDNFCPNCGAEMGKETENDHP